MRCSERITQQIEKQIISSGPALPLFTERLILREFAQRDIPDVIEIASHPKFSGYLRFHPEKIERDVSSYIEEAVAMQTLDAGREVFRLAITLKENPSQVIGCCVFHGWNESPDDNDQIGYFVHPEHQGHGYATEALSSLVAIYFSQYSNKAVEGIVHPNNVASQKVLKKLGFSKSGEKIIDMHGTKEPRWIYSLNARDFEQAIEKKLCI